MQDRKRRSKQREMEMRSTERLQKIIDTEDKEKLKTKQARCNWGPLKKSTSGVPRCTARDQGGECL